METYSYAPDNRRVVRKVPGASGFTEITLWVGSVRAAKRAIPNGAGGTTDMDVIVFAGRRFYAAGVQATPAVAEGSDRLGSSAEHKPFGENAPGVFATYSRDGNSTGLDYADQRYYQPGAGRFMTADPYLASGGTANPSSWNRYAYVEGDPVNWVDPEGLQKCPSGSQTCVDVVAPLPGSVSVESSGLTGRIRLDGNGNVIRPVTPTEKAEEKRRIQREQAREDCYKTVVSNAATSYERFKSGVWDDYVEDILRGAGAGALAGGVFGFEWGIPPGVVGAIVGGAAGGAITAIAEGLYNVTKQSAYQAFVMIPAIKSGKEDCDRKNPLP